MKWLWLLLFLLTSCTQVHNEHIDILLKWQHQSQFAGIYVANELGYYGDQGIIVDEIIEFDFQKYPIEEVQNRRVEFAVAGGDELIVARSDGNAKDVVAVAVIYKTNPVCLYSLKEKGIETPFDLVGKKVGIERGIDGADINIGISYYAMLNKLGISRTKINEVAIGYDATELLAGETDVSSGYVINEPHQVIEEGHDVNIIMPAEYGVNMYADVIITNIHLVEENPELVQDFVAATLEGWAYVIENEEQALNMVMDYSSASRDHERYMISRSIPLINAGDSELGQMENDEWQKIENMLAEQNIIQKDILIEEVYTNRFI